MRHQKKMAVAMLFFYFLHIHPPINKSETVEYRYGIYQIHYCNVVR
jgi:hypothetical protein